MPTSMVLRFRDLIAETISNHQEIIDSKGYVWWGWWNKPNENIPRHTFAHFNGLIDKNKGLDVFLVDSGRELLYRARITDIVHSKTETPIPTLEPAFTPLYYNKELYKAWFKLSEIKKVHEKEIRKWSYEEVDEFMYEDNASVFNHKLICDIQELLGRRHRTIYFIIPFEETHNTQYITLVPSVGIPKDVGPFPHSFTVLPATITQPFFTTPIVCQSTCILHLSDLHFTKDHHRFVVEPNRANRTLAQYINDDISRSNGDLSPAVVIISGDLTWQGKKEEFELAYMFLDKLMSMTGLDEQHIIIIPGNHDIQWYKPFDDDYHRDRLVDEAEDDAEKNFRDFYYNFYKYSPNEYLSMGRRIILGNYQSVDIVGLNSCRLEKDYFSGYGYIGLDQIDDAAKGLRWLEEKYHTKYRIMCMHHHVMVGPIKEIINEKDQNYSISIDSSQTRLRCLSLGIDLIAHGHLHQPTFEGFNMFVPNENFSPMRSVAVHGTGSAGVDKDHLGRFAKNCYSVYKFNENDVDVLLRSISEVANEFTLDRGCKLQKSPHGGSFFGADYHKM